MIDTTPKPIAKIPTAAMLHAGVRRLSVAPALPRTAFWTAAFALVACRRKITSNTPAGITTIPVMIAGHSTGVTGAPCAARA